MSVFLVKPTLSDHKQLLDYAGEITTIAEAEGTNNLCKALMAGEYSKWIDRVNSDTAETYLILNNSSKIVGLINIRYKLSEELKKCGGHIGYNIRPSERRKGYAKEALNQILTIASNHDLDEVLIDCYKDNEASFKTIEACGGVLIKSYYSEARRHDILRYKIDLRELKQTGFSISENNIRRLESIGKVPVRDVNLDDKKDSQTVDKYFKSRDKLKMRLALEYLNELLKVNPDVTEDMISSDIAKYLGIAKREAKKNKGR